MTAADDRMIWDLSPGSKLTARVDLHENEDQALPTWFTGGVEYRVESMHPVADPPFVEVRTDDGECTQLLAEHIRAWFLPPNG